MKEELVIPVSASPIACTLTGAEQEARGGVVQELLKNTRQIRELADGYALAFGTEANRAQTLLDFIQFERRCCPFFTFELVFEPDGGVIWLKMRGGEGVKEFIKDGLLGS